MRASRFAPWAELDVVLRSYIMSPYTSSMFALSYDASSAKRHVSRATQINIIMSSVANGLNSSGEFCPGLRIVVNHQGISSTSFVSSATIPALPAVSASEGTNTMRNTPSIPSTLQENMRAILVARPRRRQNRRPRHCARYHRSVSHTKSACCTTL